MPDPRIIAGALKIVRAAREVIADIRNWTQGCNARDINRQPVSAYSSAAVCWCSVGAALQAHGQIPATPTAAATLAAKQEKLAMKTLNSCAAAISGLPRYGIQALNDTGKPWEAHRMALACYDAAIKRLEQDLAAASREV